MGTKLSPGTRLRSTVCDTEVIVVKAPDQEVEVGCGGQAMVAADSDEPRAGQPEVEHAEGTLMGKRYADDDLGLELLCTKAGDGSLTVDGKALPQKEAKPLPSSD